MQLLLGNIHFYAILFLLYGGIVATPECSLDIRGADGSALKSVGSGVPFQLIISIRNCTDQPHIEIDDAPFAVLNRVSIQTRIINGNSSVSYVYTARIDGSGEYQIGPARVFVSKVMYETNICSIEVGGQEKATGARFIIDLSCDDNVIYVGQETVLRVRVYSITSVPEVESLHMPKIEGVSVGDLCEGSTGTEYIDKVRYRYKEFYAPLSAPAVGKFLIPAYSADIRDDQVRRGGFGFFFSAIAPTKQVFSNSCMVEVQALPSSDKKVFLIGDYQSLSASVDPDIVNVGQAVRYRLTIVGTGNALNVQAPLLSDIPSLCKYYDSLVTELPDKKAVAFEYVVQPREIGTWVIPSQEVIYFDLTKNEYSTLYSQEVVLTVLPLQNQEKEAIDKLSLDSTQNEHNFVHAVQQFHPDLCSSDPVVVCMLCISWFWYWILVICISIMLLGYILVKLCRVYYKKNHKLFRSYSAFYRARRAMSASEKRGMCSDLHDIFITFFADLFMVKKSAITEGFIKERLLKSGLLSEDGLESWNRFWYKIVHEQYGIALPKKIDKTIYTEARLWIVAFAKVGMR